MRRRVALLLAMLATGACKKKTPPPEPWLELAADPPPPAEDGGVAPRCGAPRRWELGPTTRVGDAPDLSADLAQLELGAAARSGDGWVVSGTRRRGEGRRAFVARVASGNGGTASVDLGPALEDAGPPALHLAAQGVLTAHYLPAASAASRSIGVRWVEGTAVRALADLPEARDDSFALAVASVGGRAVIAWDEARETGSAIAVAVVSWGAEGGAAPRPRIVSPAGSSAEQPVLALRPGGVWVLWIASRPEDADAEAAAGLRREGPAETRRASWVEGQALDEAGQPVGPVRALTSRRGHVAHIAAAPAAEKGAVFVVRDETEAREGAGGSLVRVHLGPDGTVAPVTVAEASVATGADILVGAQRSWLAFLDTGEHVRLVPLGPAHVPAPPASLEASADGLRLLAVTAEGEGGDTFVALRSGAGKASWETLRCRP